jgi:HD-GYP domain-containing protein (c-di-GMP phosphodiesterase class II)
MSDGAATIQDTVGLQDQGRKLLTALYVAMRALKLYPVENEIVQHATGDLHSQVSRLLSEEGELEIRTVGDFFFLNETRLRLNLSNFSTFGGVARALGQHEIGALEVGESVRSEEWIPFLSLLLRDPQGDDPYLSFVHALEKTTVQHLDVRPRSEVTEPDLEAEEALEAAKRTYAQSVQVARGVLSDIRLGRAVNVRRVKRAVQNIVDQVLSNEPTMIAMTALRDFDEYTFTHSVNVCIFSVVIGQKIGLTKHQLYDLGLGALFHDVGKSRVPTDVLNKPGGLTDEQWLMMREHPTDGLLILFHLHGFTDVPYRQMLMAYEHHMKVDVTGYPENRRPRLPSLFSRIVAVADGFDAGTSVRSYQYEPLSPAEVLREMRENPRRGFDPLLVKALINATGVYPVGTLVILDTMELGVVVAPNHDPDHMHQPVVKIISDGLGVSLAEPLQVDLSEVDPVTQKPLRSIIKHTDPQKYGVRVSDYVT